MRSLAFTGPLVCGSVWQGGVVGVAFLRETKEAAFRQSPQRAKKPGFPVRGSPDHQAYLRVPSIPSVAWQPYPSPPRTVKSPWHCVPASRRVCPCRGEPKRPRHTERLTVGKLPQSRSQSKSRLHLRRWQTSQPFFSGLSQQSNSRAKYRLGAYIRLPCVT